MRRHYIQILTVGLFISLFFQNLPAQETESFAIQMNGHAYPQEQDLVKRSLQEWLRLSFDTGNLDSVIDSLAQVFDIEVSQYEIPDSFHVDYLIDGSGTDDFIIDIRQDDWFIQAKKFDCQFDITIADFNLKLGGTSEFKGGEFKVTLSEPEIKNPVVNVNSSGGFLCPSIGELIRDGISQQIETLFIGLKDSLDVIPTEDLFAFLNPFGFLNVDDPELITAAVKSFPLDMKLYTKENIDTKIVQLIIEINFLLGTTLDSTAFIGVQPNPINGAYLDNGGFSYLYWVLQRGYSWHPDWDESERVETAFTVMKDNKIGGYRIEPRWNEIQIQAYTGSELDPDDITTEMIDDFIKNTAYWDTTAFNRVIHVLDNGNEKNLTPMMALGVGHQDRMPFNSTGQQIAPASEMWQPVDGYTAVSAEEYLYNLKIFAHATVRKFAPYISMWQIENELNAAGFAAAIPEWWRKGDLWQDDAFRNRVWEILVTAVRVEDPQAQITHNLHMLGFMQGLENWIDDMDVVGFSFYPNQLTALPNLGFSVGEYVWAVRRALKGLNQGDKPVWIIETGFPGIERDDPPSPLRLDEDLLYFSESRQADYIKMAVSSAVENGARGFFYYSLTTQEDTLADRIENRFMRYSGLIRRDSDEPKPALAVFSKLYNTYFFIPTQMAERSTLHPQSILLYQNYPNPFNPTTTISFTLRKSEYVTIEVYTPLGQKIETLLSKPLKAGNHQIEFNPDNFSSGIYFYKLRAGEFQDVKKMILLR